MDRILGNEVVVELLDDVVGPFKVDNCFFTMGYIYPVGWGFPCIARLLSRRQEENRK